mmetsp:Transcript_50398/g.134759  ORF Transcript_50398/g.134759 Transcript_50398/m.134759 type:complete len:202 (+) Transcript_50398:75-680(+)
MPGLALLSVLTLLSGAAAVCDEESCSAESLLPEHSAARGDSLIARRVRPVLSLQSDSVQEEDQADEKPVCSVWCSGYPKEVMCGTFLPSCNACQACLSTSTTASTAAAAAAATTAAPGSTRCEGWCASIPTGVACVDNALQCGDCLACTTTTTTAAATATTTTAAAAATAGGFAVGAGHARHGHRRLQSLSRRRSGALPGP